MSWHALPRLEQTIVTVERRVRGGQSKSRHRATRFCVAHQAGRQHQRLQVASCSCTLRTRPPYRADLRIARQEHDALGERLGKEEAIERIFVQTRQGVDIHRVLAGDRKLRVPVVEQAATQDARFHVEIFACRACS